MKHNGTGYSCAIFFCPSLLNSFKLKAKLELRLIKEGKNAGFVSLLVAYGIYNFINSSMMKENGEKVSTMIFSVVNKDSKIRRNLTDLLLPIYRGCTIYELEEPMDVVSYLREHTVDAVIWELTGNDSQDLSYLNIIRTQHQGTRILICADDDTLLDEAMWNGASMYFINPLLPEQIVAALGTKKKA